MFFLEEGDTAAGVQNEEQIQTEWAQKHFATLRILNICKFGAKY